MGGKRRTGIAIGVVFEVGAAFEVYVATFWKIRGVVARRHCADRGRRVLLEARNTDPSISQSQGKPRSVVTFLACRRSPVLAGRTTMS